MEDLTDMTPKAQETRAETDIQNYTKLKRCTGRKTIRVKIQLWGRGILANYAPDRIIINTDRTQKSSTAKT